MTHTDAAAAEALERAWAWIETAQRHMPAETLRLFSDPLPEIRAALDAILEDGEG